MNASSEAISGAVASLLVEAGPRSGAPCPATSAASVPMPQWKVEMLQREERERRMPRLMLATIRSLTKAAFQLSKAQDIGFVQALRGGYGLQYATGWDTDMVAKLKARKRKLAISAIGEAAYALACLRCLKF